MRSACLMIDMGNRLSRKEARNLAQRVAGRREAGTRLIRDRCRAWCRAACLPGQAGHAFEVRELGRGAAASLRIPERFREALDDLMLGIVRGAAAPSDRLERRADAWRTVRRDLIADGKMKAHVQKRIGLPAL